MKWTEEDIIAGMYVIRNSAKHIDVNPGFAASVTYQIGWISSAPKHHYILVSVTDGMAMLANYQFNKKEFANHLSKDDHGYRLITHTELGIINRHLKNRIEGRE